jgi:glycosyltransferase involved in cell wall biosynthesis
VYGAGEDTYVSGLRSFARGHDLSVSFGSAEPEEMPAVYRAHDALLFTSKWAEPFAMTPLEAMASGLPVIGTTTGGSRELFRHGENALTYTAGDPRELADRIREVARDGVLRARIAATGRAEVRAGYAEDAIVDRIESYLMETLRVWRPGAAPPSAA